ncbi:ead/Ea22-like family protein [Klebsiella pneumoniae]|uniref:ead/Ea22-like family protein n=1 Tax=Klebsiella pneumoniae TaxID=573 RepID=UPI002E18E96A|nr:ead/Ea22-like family protein [Klebsiella pneumoniae]MEC7327700.1 ead/Ea22-like family protein [Klebsiella pneumoniae]MEC7338495.1 ead/Ea22-like family protein [Klebsiella pneumoniae]
MTTDITELAQSLKAAAEKATPGEWVYFPKNTSIEYDVGSDESQGSILYVDSGDFTQAQTDRNGEFIALANPANVLALVEALEKAQGMEAYWKTQCRGITDHCEELQARIAELEREQEHLLPVGVMSEKAFHRLENSECRFIALWPRPGIFLPRKRPEDGVIVYARTAAAAGIKVEAE